MFRPIMNAIKSLFHGKPKPLYHAPEIRDYVEPKRSRKARRRAKTGITRGAFGRPRWMREGVR